MFYAIRKPKKKPLDSALFKLVKQIRYNALGFYFLSFAIPIVSYIDLDLSGIEFGFIFSLQLIGYAISSPFAGYLADRRNFRRFLIFGGSVGRFISYILLYIAFIFAHYWLMVIGMFILGFGAGFFWTPFEATVSDATEYKYRSEAFGIFRQQSGIGGFIGATIGFSLLWPGYEYNLSTAFTFSPLLLYAVANIYAGIQVIRLAPKVSYIDTEESVNSQKLSLTIKRSIIIVFIILLVILFLENMIGSLVGPFIEFFLLENITDSITFLILAYVPGAVLSILLAPRIGRIADRINPSYVLGIASAIGAVTTWLLINSQYLWQFSLLFIIDATVVSSAGLVLSKIVSGISRKRRGSVFGLHDSITNLGQIAGPLIGGALWDVKDTAPFILSIIVEGCLALIYPFVILLISKKIQLRDELVKPKNENMTPIEQK